MSIGHYWIKRRASSIEGAFWAPAFEGGGGKGHQQRERRVATKHFARPLSWFWRT